jgi:radical SAM protein with 4Fe4S-binding SPASM domain
MYFEEIANTLQFPNRPMPIWVEERFIDVNHPQQSQFPYCLAHPWRVSVAYDGRLYLCAEQNGNEAYCIGDLTKQSFKNIWFGQQRKDVIDRLNRGMFQELCPPICVLTYITKALNLLATLYPLLPASNVILSEGIDKLRGEPYPQVNFL